MAAVKLLGPDDEEVETRAEWVTRYGEVPTGTPLCVAINIALLLMHAPDPE